MTAFRSAARAIGGKSLKCASFGITSKTLISPIKPTSAFAPFASPTRTSPFAALRIAPVLGSVESMMPLHSAIASACLKSNIAADSSCWSWLSQDFAVPR